MPSLKYLIVDEGRYDLAELSPLKNLVAAIFRLENSSTREDVIEVVGNLIDWLSTPEQSQLKRSFSIWINRVLRPEEEQTPEINDLLEIKTMLADRIPEWIREGEARGEAIGKAEGEAIGEARGEAKTLLTLLKLKFHHIPSEVEQQVNTASKEQLDGWVKQLLIAGSLDEMFS